MSFGFPAYSRDSKRFYLDQAELLEVVSKALQRLGWTCEFSSPNKFIGNNSVNLWSWGEKITVEVSDDGTVTAHSECALVTQCFDWGKNARNVKGLFDELSNVLSTRTSSQPPVSAYNDDSLSPVERVISD